jgi:uncharacterized protein (DUF952 family)
MTIYHITTGDEWAVAKQFGAYTGDSLSTVGFVHCSTAAQVAGMANAIFRGRDGLVVLHIDESCLESRVTFENLEGGVEFFPHIYGPITAEAVVDVTPLAPSSNGTFEFG